VSVAHEVLLRRVEKIKDSQPLSRFLIVISQLRQDVEGSVSFDDLALDDFRDKVRSAVFRGQRPLLDKDVLQKINYSTFANVFLDILQVLRESGMGNGSLTTLTENLEKGGEEYSASFLQKALGLIDFTPNDPFFDREVAKLLALTPLNPLLGWVNGLTSRTDTALLVRGCLTCGSTHKVGLYQGGFRILVCIFCGNRVRTDFFYCTVCGNTDPNTMSFLKPSEAPFIQLDRCEKCGSVFGMVVEDMLGGAVSDPLLIYASILDLLSIH
jgi:formate dehydrogenase maturation protein FdhE